jgi:hypothetical protein
VNWEAIGAIGEVVGAAAVVVTLVFLVLQLRQNTLALRQQSARESTTSLQQVALAMTDPAVASAISRAYSEPDPEMSKADLAQLEQFLLAYLLVYQQDHVDAERGLQAAGLWESRVLMLKALFVSHSARRWWRSIGRSYFTAAFQTLVDQMLVDDPLDDGDYWKRISDSPRKT